MDYTCSGSIIPSATHQQKSGGGAKAEQQMLLNMLFSVNRGLLWSCQCSAPSEGMRKAASSVGVLTLLQALCYASHGQIWGFINPVHNLSRRFSLTLLENEDFPRTFLVSSLFYQWKNWAQRSSMVCTSPRSKQVAATQATQSSASRFNALSVSPPLARVPLTQNSHWK